MYDTIDEIAALFEEEVESFKLEYKSGRVFDSMSSDVRKEFVKDVSAFANGGGGTLIIGVAEGRDGQRSIAVGFEPVTNEKITIEQLTNIIKSNTDPVFGAFHIKQLEHPGGRVFVVNVEQADTAHQNRVDRLYYQRTGVVSDPMYDFAIRDVMNRRTHPRVKLDLRVNIRQQAIAPKPFVLYQVFPSLFNEGRITARYWALSVDLPSNVGKIGSIRAGMPMRNMGNVKHNGIDYIRVELHSAPTPVTPDGTLLLPGQTRVLSLDRGFAELELHVSDEQRLELARNEPSLYWSFYLDDSPRTDGEVAFSEWCKD